MGCGLAYSFILLGKKFVKGGGLKGRGLKVTKSIGVDKKKTPQADI